MKYAIMGPEIPTRISSCGKQTAAMVLEVTKSPEMNWNDPVRWEAYILHAGSSRIEVSGGTFIIQALSSITRLITDSFNNLHGMAFNQPHQS